MPFNFQFAFLGSGHNYFARVRRISDTGIPQGDDCRTAAYGLPKSFTEKFEKKQYSKIFIFNIRGHDFLSHYGQWADSSGKRGDLKTSPTAISELSKLGRTTRDIEEKSSDECSMILTLGPQPGSYFADIIAPITKRYRWSALPDGLEDEVQKALSANSYGHIFEIMMTPDPSDSRDDGWVVVYDNGEKFAYGGSLPLRLREALQEAKEAKKGGFARRSHNTIHRIYLNHQNPEEYILLFNDGRCYASLHIGFRDSLRDLVSIWAKGNGLDSFSMNFVTSCECSREQQVIQNAAYYFNRGKFHLAKRNAELALKYLREAYDKDECDGPVQDNLAMAIVAVRRARGSDEELDGRIQHRASRVMIHKPRENQNEDTLFRDEYMWMLTKYNDIAAIEASLDELQKPQSPGLHANVLDEWSYEKAVASETQEIGVSVHRYIRPKHEAFELEGHVLSHEMSTEQHAGHRDDRNATNEVVNGINQLRKKSRFPFTFGGKAPKT